MVAGPQDCGNRLRFEKGQLAGPDRDPPLWIDKMVGYAFGSNPPDGLKPLMSRRRIEKCFWSCGPPPLGPRVGREAVAGDHLIDYLLGDVNVRCGDETVLIGERCLGIGYRHIGRRSGGNARLCSAIRARRLI